MSIRRPRIKVSANLALAAKRKSKNVPKIEEPNQKDDCISRHMGDIEINSTERITKEIQDGPNIFTEASPSEVTKIPLRQFEEAFKYPQNLDYKRCAVITAEDSIVSDFEDNILHMDLQNLTSPGLSLSPTKSRQRIRPTPIFGQRRNSLIGTSPSPHTEEEPQSTTRQRSSNSISSDIINNGATRKLASGSLNRMRTESVCSAVSESKISSRKYTSDEHRIVSKREYQNRFNRKVLDKSSLKMFDLIYYNPTTNPMEQKQVNAVPTTSESQTDLGTIDSISHFKSTSLEHSKQPAMPVPQLKLGSNGEMMIDEKSLEIETTAEVEARKTLANSSLIYHDENTGSEGFYRKHKRTKDWLPDETIKFYRCLQTVGTDFSLMLTLFPNRTRRDLKLKFKKEERCNLNLINKALLYPGTFNIEDLKVELDAEEEEREEQERLWKDIKAKEAKQIKKLKNAPSSSSRILVSGDEIYQNENITRAKLSKRLLTSVPIHPPKQKRTKEVVMTSPIFGSIDENVLEKELTDILNPVPMPTNTIDFGSENGNLCEASIGRILNELANGTLAFVSSIDPANPDKTVNEIYVLCKETGQLSDRPLELPDEIVDAIRSVMTS